MTIASGQLATAADVLAALNGAQTSAAAAQTAATSASGVAATADGHAASAVATANTAVTDATAVNAAVPGLQQQITNLKSSADANTTTLDAHTAKIGALTNRILALQGGAPPAVPNSPTAPTSTAVTATSVTLSAIAPVGGPAPTSYRWEYKRAVDPTFITSSVTTLTGTQSGLIASTSYNFRVSAVNAAGPSTPSAVYTVSTAVSGSLVESAHGTTLTTTNGQIVDAALNVWTLITATGGRGDFQISINGVRQDVTGAVTLMKYYNPVGNAAAGTTKHSTAHTNTAGSWYISTGVSANIATFAQITGDPDIIAAPPPPPGTGTAPAPASAQGFNTQTFGPGLTVGSRGTAGANWYPTGSGSVSQLPNQKMFIRGGSSGFNYEVVTAEPGAGLQGAGNRSFGGGGYFEALISMENPGSIGGPTGWPAWWSNDMEGQISTTGAAAHWPGMPAGYGWWFEPDFMEFFDNTQQYGVQVHNWYGPSNNDYPLDPLPQINIGNNNIADPHYYGFLWVPATRTVQGRVSFWFDRVERTVFRYNFFDRNNPSSGPPNAQNAVGGMDTTPDDNGRHLQLIMGTGDNNSFTVHEVSVWQRDNSKNIFG